MSTQKRKFELFARLQGLGFTYDESAALRRIEMTLASWSTAECNGEIERSETTGKPERVSQAWINGNARERHAWPVADREAGALRRLRDIMRAHPRLWFYHQGDPRGCSLYVGRRSELPKVSPEEIARHSGPRAALTSQSRMRTILSMYYSRGLAVCA